MLQGKRESVSSPNVNGNYVDGMIQTIDDIHKHLFSCRTDGDEIVRFQDFTGRTLETHKIEKHVWLEDYGKYGFYKFDIYDAVILAWIFQDQS